jgi:hypothetical protein
MHKADVPVLAGLTQLTALELPDPLTADRHVIPIISSVTGVRLAGHLLYTDEVRCV